MIRSLAKSLPKVIGHRGALAFAPENTLASFQKAKHLGAKWVEFDVKESKDGRLIIMHDETLDRTTSGKGLVMEKNWSEISELCAGETNRFSSSFINERVPELSETVRALVALQIGANIEIKPCPGREVSTALSVANFISKHWPSSLPSPLISSFSIEALKVVRQNHPHLTVGVLFEKIPSNWMQIVQETNSKTVHVDEAELTRETVHQIISHGYPVLAYTVNSQQRAQQLFDMGVTAVFSDCPWRNN